MKSVTIILLLASIVIVIIGIFIMSVGSSSKSKQMKRYSIINGIGNLVLGLIGTTLAIVFQFADLNKEIVIVIFLIAAVIINLVQLVFKKM